MLDKMAFFVRVIRSGSISAAARQCQISISAGSRWLQELEQHFGTRLCHRTNRLLEPTAAGLTLYQEFAPLTDKAQQITRTLEDFQDSSKGHIHIACTPVYANHYLIDKIRRYRQDKPGVTFNITVTPWALDLATQSDLMISANAHFQGYREKDLLLVKREIMTSPFVVVASPNYLKQHPYPNTPEDLCHHACLYASTLTGSNDWIFGQQQETSLIKVPKTIEINDSDLLLQGALNDLGIAYLPHFVVEPALKNNQLEQILTDYHTSTWSLNLYYHSAKTASAISQDFKQFLLTSG